MKRQAGRFDCVQVNAPSPDTYMWSRNQAARWRVEGAELETPVPQQEWILASAARLMKPGGRLVYTTCSMLPEENEAQVEEFLTAHPGFLGLPLYGR